jgi:hypothetical protein
MPLPTGLADWNYHGLTFSYADNRLSFELFGFRYARGNHAALSKCANGTHTKTPTACHHENAELVAASHKQNRYTVKLHVRGLFLDFITAVLTRAPLDTCRACISPYTLRNQLLRLMRAPSR